MAATWHCRTYRNDTSTWKEKILQWTCESADDLSTTNITFNVEHTYPILSYPILYYALLVLCLPSDNMLHELQCWSLINSTRKNTKGNQNKKETYARSLIAQHWGQLSCNASIYHGRGNVSLSSPWPRLNHNPQTIWGTAKTMRLEDRARRPFRELRARRCETVIASLCIVAIWQRNTTWNVMLCTCIAVSFVALRSFRRGIVFRTHRAPKNHVPRFFFTNDSWFCSLPGMYPPKYSGVVVWYASLRCGQGGSRSAPHGLGLPGWSTILYPKEHHNSKKNDTPLRTTFQT